MFGIPWWVMVPVLLGFALWLIDRAPLYTSVAGRRAMVLLSLAAVIFAAYMSTVPVHMGKNWNFLVHIVVFIVTLLLYAAIGLLIAMELDNRRYSKAPSTKRA
jgi:thiol:disulfide interchange protein